MSTAEYYNLRKAAGEGNLYVSRTTILALLAEHDALHERVEVLERQWARSQAARRAAKKRAQKAS